MLSKTCALECYVECSTALCRVLLRGVVADLALFAHVGARFSTAVFVMSSSGMRQRIAKPTLDCVCFITAGPITLDSVPLKQ
jgi:hypothetical protein